MSKDFRKDWLNRTQPVWRVLRRRRIVLLNASSPMNVVVMRPMIDALAGDPRVRLLLAAKFCRKDDAAGLIQVTGLQGVTPISLREAERLRADLYLTPETSRPPGTRSHRRVLTFHGASFKGRTIVKKTVFFDSIMLVGEWQRRQFLARKYFDEGDPRLVPVGMPKLDSLARGEIDVAPLRARLGIAPGERCVLYAPTWSEHSSLFTIGEAMLEHAARVPGVRILVKLHDHLLDPTRSPIDWLARARVWPWPNVTLYEDLDVVPLLALADVLVSDASSVLQEFMLLDRPVVYCDVPGLFRSKRYRRTADRDGWHQKGGVVIAKGDQIGAALDRAFTAPGEFSAMRKKIASDVFFNPGTATEHAMRLLYRELGLAPLP